MHAFEYILVLLAAVLLSNLISQRFPRVSTPLVQIVLGVVIALVINAISTDIPAPQLDPELFLILFIAPLLFDEAKKADKPQLWRLRRPILSLAIGLVFATCLVVGFATHWLVPSIPLAAAFAFAAALAPTDAVAIIAMKDSTNISGEQDELLKGESLLNDAASIVSFQFALAAVMTSTFSLFSAEVSFVMMFVGGIAVGVVLMLLRYLVVRAITAAGIQSSTFYVLFEIITPCLVFLVAELLHVSSIIAVVAAGITYSYSPRIHSPNTARQNIVSSSVWSVISFTVKGLVFLMLGTQLPRISNIIVEHPDASHFFLFAVMVLILLIILLLRFIWVFIMNRNVNLSGGHVLMAGHDDPEQSAVMTALPNDDEDASDNPAFTIGFRPHDESLDENLEKSAFANTAAPPQAGQAGQALTRPAWESQVPAGGPGPGQTGSVPAGSVPTGGVPTGEAAGPVPGQDGHGRDGHGHPDYHALREKRRQMKRQMLQAEKVQARSDPHYWRLHLRDAALLSIAGAKGAITLALLFAIPFTLNDGSDFPGRDIILFVAAGVILLSLLTTSIAIPLLSPHKDDGALPGEQAKAKAAILRAVIQKLVQNSKPSEAFVTGEVTRHYYERIRRVLSAEGIGDSEEFHLRSQIVVWERQRTLELIDEKRIHVLLGMTFLSQITRQLARLEHRSTVLEGLRSLRDRFRLYMFWRRRSMRSQIAGQPSPRANPELVEKARIDILGLQHENTVFVLQKLKELQACCDEAAEPAFSPDLIDEFITDFSRRLDRYQQRRSRTTMFPPAVQNPADREELRMRVTARALEWEREGISEAVREGRISRKFAKEMYDNVAAMELDIEAFLE
ncbi:MAG: sodium:proton antiporter [Coriobacteriia bacterium]|nr:sodium:proton antiporter [Coriobacteriia bacterium]